MPFRQINDFFTKSKLGKNQSVAIPDGLQEFHILGSNYLSQLRDLIKCPTDLMTGGDVSENPPWVKKVDTLPPVPSAKV